MENMGQSHKITWLNETQIMGVTSPLGISSMVGVNPPNSKGDGITPKIDQTNQQDSTNHGDMSNRHGGSTSKTL